MWLEHSDIDISINKTYLFGDFCYKITKYVNYLNLPKSLACTIEETEEYHKNVAETKTSSLLEGTLILMAIEKINKKWLCLKCSNPMKVNQEKKVVKLGMCNVVNKL